jgi:formylglycine-generating enzyme required for sulfatase activity
MTNLERAAGRLPAGWEYTLPTEAQWERACRARTETRFSFGDDESNLGDYAWFEDNAWNAGEEFAHRVGLKKANPWGLHDMYGNVNEWCRDYFAEKLPGGRDPEVTADGKYRIFRSGGFGATAGSFGRLSQRNRKRRSRPGMTSNFRTSRHG